MHVEQNAFHGKKNDRQLPKMLSRMMLSVSHRHNVPSIEEDSFCKDSSGVNIYQLKTLSTCPPFFWGTIPSSRCSKPCSYQGLVTRSDVSVVCLVRWPTSALRIPNDTPNSKPHSEFQNLTPNSKTSLRIPKSHSEFQNLTPNSKSSLRIPKSHSEFQNLTPNSKSSLRILKTHSEFLNLTPNS